ncbi:hypothetical protein F4703DRAFT_1946482 [Phycomyces blakesleeanus]
MAYEFNSLSYPTQTTHQPKRRHEDDEDESQVEEYNSKRFNDTRETSFGDEQPRAASPLPSITYASPDFRPPPRQDALWLQPVQTTDDSEDDNNSTVYQDEDCAMY